MPAPPQAPAKTNDNLSGEIPSFIFYLLIAVAVFVAYANVYGNAFLFDDEQFIVQNGLLRSWHSIGALLTSSGTAGSGLKDLYYRPLQGLLYLVIYQLFGLSAAAFHFLNIALHAAAGCLVYALGRRLNFRQPAALIAALLWALHPLHTEAVTYMSSTIDPLYTCFCLLSLVIVLPDFAPKKFLIAAPLYMLALLSKESAIVFPALAMACQFLLSQDRFDIRIYRKTWPFWLVAGIYVLIRLQALGHQHEFYATANVYTEHASYRFYTFLATLPVYAKLLVWPTCLHMDRSFPVYPNPWNADVMGGAAILIAALTQIAWGRGRRGLPLTWGFLWFGIAHSLSTGIVIPVNGLIFEHWLYLPSVGLFLGATQSITTWLEGNPLRVKWKNPAAGLAIVAALATGARTFNQNETWHDPIVFYNHLIHCGANTARVHNNLANAYSSLGRNTMAIEELKTAIKLSNDKYPQTDHNLALALLGQPDLPSHVDEAIGYLQRAIAIDPNFFESYELLANIYAWRRDHEKETEYRQKAFALRRKLGVAPDVYVQPVLPGHAN